MKIGYWNIQRQELGSIGSYLIALLSNGSLDVLFLSEFENININLFSKELNKIGYSIVDSGHICEKVLPITKNNSDMKVITEKQRSIFLYSKEKDLLLVGLHLEDNTHVNDDETSITHIQTLSLILDDVNSSNHKQVVYVGDFNCMPYSKEMVYFKGLHCVLFKDEMKTKTGCRRKNYNPMMLALNEEKQLYGSFRYTTGSFSLYWYAYDQVVVSEELTTRITNIDYLKEISGKSLLSKNSRSPLVSDHLPLVFEIV